MEPFVIVQELLILLLFGLFLFIHFPDCLSTYPVVFLLSLLGIENRDCGAEVDFKRELSPRENFAPLI